jgi:hypothetical protein
MLTLLFSHTAPRPHPLGPLSLYFTHPFLSGVSSGRAARVRAATASFPVPILLLHCGGSGRQPYVAMVQASKEGRGTVRGRGGRSTLSREAPLDRGASSSGSHEAVRAMEVSADFWG